MAVPGMRGATLPGVQSVRDDDGIFSLQVNEPHETIPALLAEVQRQRAQLVHLTTRQASLEDVFVKLTGPASAGGLMATIEQPPVKSNPEQAMITNGRWSGYTRLLQMRMLELWREPEVIFWVFVFPLLLALGLGHCLSR